MATRYATEKNSLFTLEACELAAKECPGVGNKLGKTGVHNHFIREYFVGAAKTHRRDVDGNIIMSTGPDPHPVLVDAGTSYEQACLEFDALYGEYLGQIRNLDVAATPVREFHGKQIGPL